jgi:hypothetical protein
MSPHCPCSTIALDLPLDPENIIINIKMDIARDRLSCPA